MIENNVDFTRLSSRHVLMKIILYSPRQSDQRPLCDAHDHAPTRSPRRVHGRAAQLLHGTPQRWAAAHNDAGVVPASEGMAQAGAGAEPHGRAAKRGRLELLLAQYEAQGNICCAKSRAPVTM